VGQDFLDEPAGASLRRCDASLVRRSLFNAAVRRLDEWLESLHIYPRSVGEFDDSALMKAFGQGGAGIFIAPTAIANELVQQYGVEVVGSTDAVVEPFYAISTQRIISNPAVAAINATAKAWLK
jgi:LysR family transcriptional activator of nhaA